MCKICAQCVECREEKTFKRWFFFTATSRMRWKKFFSATTMRWNFFSPLKSQMFTAKFNAYLKFTGNIVEVSERWRSGKRSCWHVGDGRGGVYGGFSFVRNPVKIKISPLKAANLTKIHRLQRQKCGPFAVKFFYRYSPLMLHYFLIKPQPGNRYHKLHMAKIQLWDELWTKDYLISGIYSACSIRRFF